MGRPRKKSWPVLINLSLSPSLVPPPRDQTGCLLVGLLPLQAARISCGLFIAQFQMTKNAQGADEKTQMEEQREMQEKIRDLEKKKRRQHQQIFDLIVSIIT